MPSQAIAMQMTCATSRPNLELHRWEIGQLHAMSLSALIGSACEKCADANGHTTQLAN
jgi:hypothetical protein